MLKFSDILRAEDIPKEKTRLVRHTEETAVSSAYLLWLEDIEKFEEYQAQQDRVKFEPGEFIASFVKSPTGETLFVGLYKVLSRSEHKLEVVCPLNQNKYQARRYEMHRLPIMDGYVGKLVISWKNWTPDGEKNPGIALVNRAHKYEKRVIEVLRERFEIPFPGFRRFHVNVDSVPSLPESWKQPLRSVWGIYLLVCNATGKQYVGAAYNVTGLYGRLCDYKNPQQVGHKRLVSHDKTQNNGQGYQCCILDVVTPGVSESEITSLEGLWKGKLRTRETWGLNDN